MSKKLKGWAYFSEPSKGEYFLSDSYKTLAECRRAYGGSDTGGYIDLSKIPNEAIQLTANKAD